MSRVKRCEHNEIEGSCKLVVPFSGNCGFIIFPIALQYFFFLFFLKAAHKHTVCVDKKQKTDRLSCIPFRSNICYCTHPMVPAVFICLDDLTKMTFSYCFIASTTASECASGVFFACVASMLFPTTLAGVLLNRQMCTHSFLESSDI